MHAHTMHADTHTTVDCTWFFIIRLRWKEAFSYTVSSCGSAVCYVSLKLYVKCKLYVFSFFSLSLASGLGKWTFTY